jgi:formylglycine-generating enzyme required for sulfatase activity/serine/threonine protein kinase
VSPPVSTSVAELLQELPLLDPAQREEVAGLRQQQFTTPGALTAELVRRGWLTAFQRDQLLQGRGRELVLGPYLLLDRLGHGGMGQVFKARHQILGRVVALKVARKDVPTDATDERRFLREMQATAQLCHPNIVTAYDAAVADGAYVFAMEYVEGTDLGRLLAAHGHLPVAHACAYVRQAALGLQHAHERGMIHRDIKPANLLLTADRTLLKISDLGLVRLGPAEEGQLTSPGLVIGTPDYLAPEQASAARNVDIRADLYSLGCTLYHCLAGRPPFVEGTALEKLFKHVAEQPPPVEALRPDVPAGVAAVVARLLAKKPADRYQTPAEVAQALEPFCGPLGKLPPVPGSAPASPPAPEDSLLDSALRPTSITAAPPQPAPPDAPPPAATGVPCFRGPSQPLPEGGGSEGPRKHATQPSQRLVLAVVAPQPAPPPAPSPAPQSSRPSRRLALAAVAAVVVLVGAGLAYGLHWAAAGNPARKPPLTNSLDMQLAWVPPGTFTMGASAEEVGRRDDEGPAHPVTISRPFYLAAQETTVAQFRAFVQATRYRTEAETDGAGGLRWDGDRKAWEADPGCTWHRPGRVPDDNEPVVCVSRRDALTFCYWLDRVEGKTYRLPTEAEWEYACRAGTTTAFGTGAVLAPGQANFGPGGSGRTTRAGSFPANAWGLCDFHGNAWEWCADSYSPTYYRVSPGRDPSGPEPGEVGVLRGGSWCGGAADCRSAARLGVPVKTRRTDVGFRVVLEAGVR